MKVFEWLKNWLKWRQFQRWASVEWAKLEIKGMKIEMKAQRRSERLRREARRLAKKRKPTYIQ